jgi:hypothetical protein
MGDAKRRRDRLTFHLMCYHEAGHLVVGNECGMGWLESVVTDCDGVSRRDIPIGTVTTRENATEEVMMLLAGPNAEAHAAAGLNIKERATAWSHDLHEVDSLMEEGLVTQAEFEHAREAVADILLRRWADVEWVAGILKERRRWTPADGLGRPG